MNRIFGLTGFLAAGTAFVWVWLIVCLPWLYGSPKTLPMSKWLIWGGASAVGVAILGVFVFRAGKAHWAALRHHRPMAKAGWRGVCGVYLLNAVIFAVPVFTADPSGTHQSERVLYAGLAGIALALGILAAMGGWRRVAPETNRLV